MSNNFERTDYTVLATEIHAFFLVDKDGEEGIPAFTTSDGGSRPLIATDRVAMESLRPIAEALAMRYGTRLEHVKFTSREHVEWVDWRQE